MAADIELVFGVAGGGSVSGESGQLIYNDLSSIVNEINSSPFKIKFEIDPSTEQSFSKLKDQIGNIEQNIGSLATSVSGSFGQVADVINNIRASLQGVGSSKGTTILFGSNEIEEEKERVREYLSLVQELRRDLLQSINQDSGKGGPGKYMSAFGIDALQEVQKELWKAFDTQTDVFKALESRLEKSTISSTIQKIFGEAKAQFEAFAPYVEKASSIGLMDQGKYASLFGKESDHAAVSAALAEETQSVQTLNTEFEQHKKAVDEAANAESVKASDSGSLSSSLTEEASALDETTRAANETEKAYNSIIDLIGKVGTQRARIASLSLTTPQSKIDQETAKLNEYTASIDKLMEKHQEAFTPIQQNGIAEAWNEVNREAEQAEKNAERLKAYREILELIGKQKSLTQSRSKLDTNTNEYKELTRQIEETAAKRKELQDAFQKDLPKGQQDEIIKKMEDLANAEALAEARKKDLDERMKSKGMTNRLDNAIIRALALDQVLLKLFRRIKEMIKASIEIDAAMTQLRIVTNDSISEVNQYGETIAKVAKEIGASIKDLVDSATVFARLGYTLDESVNLSKYSAMLKNVGDIDISAAQDSLTAITKAFNISANDIESVMDKMVVVGNNFPISVSQIAEGMNNAGSSLAAAGNSFEQSVALLTAANTTVQNVSKASTALRTLTARIRRTKVELDDLGESVETSKFEEVVNALSKHNVSLVDMNGNYRTTYDIVKDIAAIWKDLSNIEQSAVAEQLAGTRQQNVFFSIIEQFQEASGAMAAMESSSGALQNSYDKYLLSMKAHTDMFSAAVNELSTNLASSSLVKAGVDIGRSFVSVLSEITDKLEWIGGIIPVISGFITFLIAANLKSIFNLGMFQNMTKAFTALKEAAAAKSVLGVLGNPVVLTGIVVALTSIVAIITKIKQNIEEARQSAVQAANDISQDRAKSRASLEDYIERIQELKKKAADTSISNRELYNVQYELLSIQDELIDKYGDQAAALNLIGDSAEATTEKLLGLESEYEKTNAYKYLADNEDAIKRARKAIEDDRLFTSDTTAFNSLTVSESDISNLEGILDKYSAISLVASPTAENPKIIEYDIVVNSNAKDAQEQLLALQNDLNATIDGKPLLYSYDALGDSINNILSKVDGIIEKHQTIYDEYVQSQIVTDNRYSSVMNEYADAYQKYQDALKYPGSPMERNRQTQEALDEIDAIEKRIGEMDFLDSEGNIQVGVKNYFSNLIEAFEEESEKQKLKLQVELDLDNNKELQDQLRTALEAFSADGTINKSDLMVSLNQMEAGDFSGVADSQVDAFNKLSVAAKMFNLDLSDLVDIFIDFGLVSNDVLSETEGNASKLSTFESQMASFANTAKDSMDDASESTATLADRIDHVVNALKPLADMQDGLADGFTIAAEQALEYAKTYPEILEGAQLAADGQVKLNEDVVNAFIDGKEAEIKSSLDADIAELEGRREYEAARAKLAQMELDLAKGVRDGTIDLSEEQAVQLINDANQVLIAKLHDDGEVASSYEAAAVFMAEQAHKLGVYSTEVANALASNFVGATADAANTGGSNMTTLANTIVNVVKAAQEAARAIKGMASGDVRGSAATYSPGYGAVKNRTKNANMTDTGTGGRTQLYRDYANGNISLSAVQAALRNVNTYTFSSGVFTPSGFSYEATPATFERFISDLSDTVDIYNKTIAEIDGELALLQALRKQNLSDFKSNKSDSGSGGSGGSGGGSGGGSSTEDLEDALEAQKELFKKYLADVEHEIEVRSHFDNETKNIANLYVNLIHEVEEELKTARAMGLSDTDDYIQELQDKWIDYTEALKDLQDSVRNNAKDALDDLADIRVNMLKQEISDRKDALDKQLDMLKEFYDKQKDMLQDQYDEEKYLEEQAEKRKEVTKIQEELNRLEYDNSAWAQKRKLELAQELADAQKELDDFEKDHALDVAQEELDRLYEMQEKEIQNELDLLDEKEKDSKALYEQALEDIKNGSIDLYNEMIKWNETYGDGIEDTIKNAWEEAYKALEEYKTLYDETFNGVNLGNATGYKPENGPYEGSKISGSGAGFANSGSSGSTSSGTATDTKVADDSKSTAAAPALAVGTAVSVKSGTKWYADSYGGGRSGTAKSGKIKYINLKGTHPYNIDGLGWVKKTDIVGYAAGTRSALPGVHSVDERGDEYIFQSSDGSRYRLFSGGEKVLNARATNFLYDFANNGSQILQKLINAVSGGGLGAIRPIQNNVQLVTGDIIINGNTDKATISEIRRAQRESVELVLRQFNKFNK